VPGLYVPELLHETANFFSIVKAVGKSSHRGKKQNQKKIENEFSHWYNYASGKKKKQEELAFMSLGIITISGHCGCPAYSRFADSYLRWIIFVTVFVPVELLA